MSGKSKSTTTTSQSNNYEPWVTQAGQDVFSNASTNQQNNPWQAYDGPSSADFGQSWYDANSALSSMLGQTMPQTEAATGSLTQMLGTLDPTKTTQSYMSPYLDQVLSPTLANINDAYRDQNRNLAAEATMAGAYGDSAHGVQRSQNELNRLRSIGEATAGAYDKGWTQAIGQKEAELANILKTSSGLNTVGNTEFGQSTELAKLLAGLGTQQQQVGQTGIQNEIALNLQNQEMPTKQLTSLAQILAMLPKNTSGTGSSTTSQPDNTGIALLTSLI